MSTFEGAHIFRMNSQEMRLQFILWMPQKKWLQIYQQIAEDFYICLLKCSIVRTELFSLWFEIYILSNSYMWTTFHIHIPIESFEETLEAFPTQRQKNKYCKDMFSCTHTQAMKSIADMKAKWMTVIPSQWCDNQSTEWKCLWHPHED